jgi:hypothetical protein
MRLCAWPLLALLFTALVLLPFLTLPGRPAVSFDASVPLASAGPVFYPAPVSAVGAASQAELCFRQAAGFLCTGYFAANQTARALRHRVSALCAALLLSAGLGAFCWRRPARAAVPAKRRPLLAQFLGGHAPPDRRRPPRDPFAFSAAAGPNVGCTCNPQPKFLFFVAAPRRQGTMGLRSA